jgi:hypothetical protein
MKEDFLINKYSIVWIEITDKLFFAEIRHVEKNEFCGSLTTPVGIVIGFVQNNPSRWEIKIVLRNDLKYSQTNNKTFVLSKTAFNNKLLYYIEKAKDVLFPNFRVDKNLEEEIRKLILTKNLCSEPYSISTSEEKQKSFHFYGSIIHDDID